MGGTKNMLFPYSYRNLMVCVIDPFISHFYISEVRVLNSMCVVLRYFNTKITKKHIIFDVRWSDLYSGESTDIIL